MSQTPLEPGSQQTAADYMDAWRAIYRWTSEGRSWSGRERHCCFLNTGGEWFADISAVSGLNYKDDGRGLATVDWDHDGDLDLWMTNRLAPQVRYLRNDGAAHSQFIAFRLTGTSCNRDAIGTRVELTTTAADAAAGPSVRSRSLRAGEGFLSQSSKWLHFGLGGVTSVPQVTVHWPDGSQQTFVDLQINQHYQIVQGETTAQVWQRPTPASSLAPSPAPKRPLAISQAHWLAARYPLPRLTYQTAEGTPQQLPTGNDEGPLLLNLWASWCQACQQELNDWTAQAAEFREAGVRVLALSVDGLEEDGTAPADSQQMLEQMGYPFAWGRATLELVETLQRTHDTLLTTREQLPVPCSFLLDAQGELAAVYWGAVSPEQVAADVARLHLTGEALFDSAVPRPGRWEVRPRGIRRFAYLRHANHAAQQQDLETAAASVARAIEEDPNSIPARLLAANLAIRVQQPTLATQQLETILQLDATHSTALMMLGDLQLRQGNLAAAEQHYQALLQLAPEHPQVLRRWGQLRSQQGDFDTAVQHLRAALAKDPNNAALHGDLANGLRGLGRYREAFQEYQIALQGDASLVQTAAEFAWLLSTCNDATVRNGQVAVTIARQCVERTGGRDPSMLDKLAAAQAEVGQFQQAAATARRAQALASQLDRPDLATDIGARLALYEASQPYRAAGP